MELMVEVVGMKAFKGHVQGSDIDSGEMYAFVRLDERFNKKDESGVNWKSGHTFEAWRMPNAETVMKVIHLKPSIQRPVPIKLIIERVSNGKETREVVIDVEPVGASVVDQKTGEIKETQPLKKVA